ncbi:unnamed protein product [Cochlearia groenlandica]
MAHARSTGPCGVRTLGPRPHVGAGRHARIINPPFPLLSLEALLFLLPVLLGAGQGKYGVQLILSLLKDPVGHQTDPRLLPTRLRIRSRRGA